MNNEHTIKSLEKEIKSLEDELLVIPDKKILLLRQYNISRELAKNVDHEETALIEEEFIKDSSIINKILSDRKISLEMISEDFSNGKIAHYESLIKIKSILEEILFNFNKLCELFDTIGKRFKTISNIDTGKILIEHVDNTNILNKIKDLRFNAKLLKIEFNIITSEFEGLKELCKTTSDEHENLNSRKILDKIEGYYVDIKNSTNELLVENTRQLDLLNKIDSKDEYVNSAIIELTYAALKDIVDILDQNIKFMRSVKVGMGGILRSIVLEDPKNPIFIEL